MGHRVTRAIKVLSVLRDFTSANLNFSFLTNFGLQILISKSSVLMYSSFFTKCVYFHLLECDFNNRWLRLRSELALS